MKLIGRPQPFNPNAIYIHPYQRVALGLESQTRVYLTALPPSKKEVGQVGEIMLTTIHPDQWSHLHRLSIQLIEKEGIVAAVLGHLKDTANILVLETLRPRVKGATSS